MKRTNYMKTFDFIQATISHNIKDPHSKALEPDCLSPLLAIAIQPPRGEEDILVIGVWLLFGYWCLGFGAYPFITPAAVGITMLFQVVEVVYPENLANW